MSLGVCARRPNLAWPTIGFRRNLESPCGQWRIQSEDTSREVSGSCSGVWQAALCQNFDKCDRRVSDNQGQPTTVIRQLSEIVHPEHDLPGPEQWTWSRGRSRVGHVSPRKCVCGVWRGANSFSTSWRASEPPTSEMWPPKSPDLNPLG